MKKIKKGILSAVGFVVLVAYLAALGVCGFFEKLWEFICYIANKTPWQAFMLIFLGLFGYCVLSLDRSLIFIIPMVLSGAGFVYSVVKWAQSRRKK